MDVCTDLVRAYLHVNGYFTTTDYPLVEAKPNKAPRTLTDIDILAVRFGRDDASYEEDRFGVKGPLRTGTDPALKCTDTRTDMIVAEIKQGRAEVNPGLRRRNALTAALVRFGCCPPDTAPGVVKTLLQLGRAETAERHIVRMVLFASRGEQAPRGWHWIHIDHVFHYLQNFLQQESDTLATVDFHDPALAWLSLLRKCDLQLNHGAPRR